MNGVFQVHALFTVPEGDISGLAGRTCKFYNDKPNKAAAVESADFLVQTPGYFATVIESDLSSWFEDNLARNDDKAQPLHKER